MPTVAIVTPSYNQAAFLEQTLRSVLDQGIPGLRYYVIDGASTDASPEIIRRYASQLAGWVSEPDRGQADAINKGLRQALGHADVDILAWLNSDDYYLPGAIQRALRAFDENPRAGLVYGNVLSVDGADSAFNLQTFAPFDLPDLMSFRIISQPAVFMRRTVLEQAGLLDPDYHCLLDHHLWLRLARLAPVVYIPETLAAARYHAQAKNIARAVEFGREAYRLVDWMQASADFKPLFAQHRARILAGAARFDAFYLLDAGEYRAALQAYARVWRYNPALVFKDAHRVAYAALSLVLPLARLRALYGRLRQARSIKNGTGKS